MLFAKFVTDKFFSPGDYEIIDYSNFGEPIKVDAAPASKGQCASGIHVIPLSETIDFENVIWTSKIIILEADESDIAFQGNSGKLRLKRATPLREATLEEQGIIRNAACKDAECAYLHALNFDQNSSNQTRNAACQEPGNAYVYALNVDKEPSDQTRTAACQQARYAYYYALKIDKSPCDETRNAACEEAQWAYLYALEVDKAPSEQTKNAVKNNNELTRYYTKFF